MAQPKYPLRALIPALLIALSACGEPVVNNKAQAASPKSSQASTHSNVPDNVAQTIKKTLEKNYAEQKLKIKSVNSTPVQNLYEVLVDNGQVVYTDATGDYMIVGDFIRTKDGKSLTEERRAELNAIDFNALPLDKAVKEVRGNGQLKVAVFSDPDCPFCKRLEKEFAKMDNITIYTFLLPIPSLHPAAYQKAVNIWCQPNRTKAWTDWMRNGKEPAKVKECANPIEDLMNLGLEYNVNGTPTMVFPNGKIQGGYAPMPHLEVMIKTNQK